MRDARGVAAAALAVALAACNGTASPTRPDTANDDRSNEMSDGPPIKTRAPAPPAGAPARSDRTFPETVDGAAALPAVTSAAELERLDGEDVRVIGVYVERDARKRTDPPPVYAGHVAIDLGDGTVVSLLPVWHKDARRPEAEVDRFRGQRVEAVGTVFRRAPPDPQGGASPTGPALLAVKALRAAP